MKIRVLLLIFGSLIALSSSGQLLASTVALSIPLPEPLPQIKVLTVLVALHLLGMCFGLGGATMLDLWIWRWMRRGKLPVEVGRIFHFISGAVTIGLCLLWVSGLGLLALYEMDSPEKFENPKLWAKIIVVTVLTINGMIIHMFVLPEALRDLSRPLLFGVSRRRAAFFLASGAVSGASWYTAFAFGIFRELNNSVTLTLLVIMWLTLIVAAFLAAILVWFSYAAAAKKPFSLSHRYKKIKTH